MKQKRIGRKAVSWLLTLVMLMGLLPMPTASAAADATTVTEGNTYYFDLSGVTIPGTANDALPDASLHYVPFTYVGSVNAYVLNEASSGKTGASANASQTTDPNATYGYTYNHSLFVADYNVTVSVKSWNELNAAGLIFGNNNYLNGGITYSLRAPSAGSSEGTNGASPTNNEWDAILDKNGGYIKNWLGYYSWGQDTYSGGPDFRAIRGGSNSARYWEYEDLTYPYNIVNFRPVLEVPSADTPASDGLKAVTLKLNGGKLGTSSDDIQIVVKNGASFTAPASAGLTRPTGVTGDYFMWRGDDGKLYAPEASVPSTVTALTALYQNLPELDVPAVAAIEYRGAAVTVSRSDEGRTTDLTYTCAAEAAGEVTVTAKWYTADEGGNPLVELSSAPKDVGEYVLVLTTAETSAYAAGRWERSFTIRTKNIKIENCVAETKTYDGNTTATIKPGTLSGVVDGDDVTVAEASIKGTFASANAGENIDVTTTNRFTLSGAQKDNYNLLTPTGIKGTIEPKAVTLTIVAASRPYEKDKLTVDLAGATITVNDKVGDDDVSADLSQMTGAMDDDAKGTGKRVHLTGTASLTGTKAGNYVLNTQPTTATVDITSATWTDKTATASERPDVEATVELAGLIAPGGQLGAPSESGSMLSKCELLDNKLVFKIKTTAAENETTTVTVPVKNATNYADYDITVTITAQAKQSISADVLNAITGYSGTYDAKEHDAVVVTDTTAMADYTLTYSDSENGTYLDTKTVKDVADSGPVWVKVSRPGYADETKSVDVTVSALDINGAMITLNEIPTYSGNEETVTVASVTVGGGDTAVTLAAGDYTVSGDKATNVVTNTLTVTGQANCTGTAQINWSLKPKNITDATITLGTQATYNGQSHDVVISKVALSGYADLVEGADKDYTITDGGSATNVEETELTITGRGNFTGTKTTTWKLNPKDITGATTITLGTQATYNGQSQDVVIDSVTVTGIDAALQKGTDYDVTNGSATNVAETTLTITGKGNFTGEATQVWKLNTKEVTVTAKDKTAMVGDSAPSLDSPVKDTDYTVEGLVGSDALTGHSVKLAYASTPDMSQPGEYGIVPSAATENTNTNYTIRYVNGKLMVGGIVLPGKDATTNDDDVTVKPATSDTEITDNGNGSRHVGAPGGSVILPGADQDKSTTGDNVTVTVTGEFDVKDDGTVILPSGSSATVGDKTVTGPATIYPDGVIDVDAGGSVGKTGETPVSGPVVVLPGKDKKPGTADDMTVTPAPGTDPTVDPGTGNVTVPENGKVDMDTDGDGVADKTVTGPATIKPDGSIKVEDGGTVDTDHDGKPDIAGPAEVDPDGGVTGGSYILPGKDDAAGTADDVILTPKTDGGSATKNTDGSYSVTGGGSVVLPGADQDKSTTGDNVTVTVNGPFTVKPDGTVVLPSGSSATVGGKTVTGPATIRPDGVVDVGAGGKVSDGSKETAGPVVVLPGKDKTPGTSDDMTVKPVSPTEVTVDPGTGEITVPENGKVDMDTNGDGETDKTVTGPATIKPDGEIEVQPGGTVDTDGDGKTDVTGPGTIKPDGKIEGGAITLPGKDQQMGTDDDVTVKPDDGSTATKKDDGSYDVSAPGGKVTQPDGKETDVEGGFNVKPDGTIELPNGSTAATEDGKVITGPATIKPDGEIEVQPGGTVDTDGDGKTDVAGPGTIKPDGKIEGGAITLPGKDQQMGTGDDVTVKPDDGSTATKKTDGSYSVTGGGSVVLPGADQDKSTTGDNVTVTVNGPFTVKPDGTVVLPDSGSSAMVGGKTVTGPATIKPDGTVERPSSGGGGGGSSSTTYPPTVKDPDHGSVTVTPKNPSKGDNVIIRPNPDEGYEVDDVVVTKPDCSKVPVKDNGDGSWSFVQPNAKVTVSVTFKPASATDGVAYDQCSGGSGCLIWPFTDASTTAWYHDGVHFCLENGLMLGVGDDKFAPEGIVSRGQIVTILWRLEGQPKAEGDSYSDVLTGLYYTEAVAWAAENGIVTGYPDGTFHPNASITREQMATILYRYCKYKGLTVSAAADLSGFADRNRIAPYAEEALAWANAVELVNGKSASALDPTGSATRAQVATILQRFCENILKG